MPEQTIHICCPDEVHVHPRREANRKIYLLEDSVLSARRLRESVIRACPGVEIESFKTRLKLEEAWKRERPFAVIIDLLVPDDRHHWLARTFVGRPSWYEWPFWFIRRWVTAWYLRINDLDVQYLSELRNLLADEQSYIRQLRLNQPLIGGDESSSAPRFRRHRREDLVRGRNHFFGGVEFLRERVIQQDQGDVRFYLYSIWLNPEWERGVYAMRMVMMELRHICKEIPCWVDGLASLVHFTRYAKGFIRAKWGVESADVETDELPQLIAQLADDLSRAK